MYYEKKLFFGFISILFSDGRGIRIKGYGYSSSVEKEEMGLKSQVEKGFLHFFAINIKYNLGVL